MWFVFPLLSSLLFFVFHSSTIVPSTQYKVANTELDASSQSQY